VAKSIAGVVIPDSAMAREATELVRPASDDLLFNHSRRAYLRGMLHDHRHDLQPDPELLYVAAMFHDLGLIPKYRSTDQGFELDGADAARTCLLDHGNSHDKARNVWLAIALHTTPEIPDHGPDRAGDRGAPTSRVHRWNPAGVPRPYEGPARNHVRHDERRHPGIFRTGVTRTKLVDLINPNEPPQ
jgi:hypothetical protein